MRFSLCFLFALFTLAACSDQRSSTSNALEVEARTFMADYADDLRSRDGAAVAARYHPDGAFFKGEFASYQSIYDSYTGGWPGPSAFEWGEMSYEQLGPDAILVTGSCHFERGDSLAALNIAYTSVLKREGSKLKIRLEDETVVNP